jgi:hypothetical protein
MKDFNKFIKVVRNRNIREWLACLIVLPVFIYTGLGKSTIVGKLLCFEIAFSALFISYYIYIKSHKNINRNIENIKEQNKVINDEINLLATVKYWYVLPVFIGLVGLTLQDLYFDFLEGESLFVGGAYLASVFLLGIFIIYLNENKGVQDLKSYLAHKEL